jgi:TonB family protein
MNAMLLQMLTDTSLGLITVLLLRKPIRHAFGAGPAFTLWGLPLLLAAAPWLPMPATTWSLSPMMAALPTGTWMATEDISTHGYTWPTALWLLGTAYSLANLIFRYVRMSRGCQAMPEAMWRTLLAERPALAKRRLRLHAQGPAVMWALRPCLLLPADFLERYDAEARDMVLRHELAHLRRGDAWWKLLGECTLVLLWFHPLAWFALSRFHLDLELACDERVLRTAPEHELRYAQTLMRSTGMDAHLAMIPWLTEPQLKERLTMISRQPRSAGRRRFGYATLAALFASSAVIAQTGGAAPAGSSGPTQDIPFNASMPPPYPPDAIKNHEQGMVMLKVLVGTDGTARQITVDNDTTKASPELAKVASDTAMKWHFNPKIENGRAIEAWTKVPVLFSLTPLPPHPPGPPGPPPRGQMPPPPPGAGMPMPPPPLGGGPSQPTSSNS